MRFDAKHHMDGERVTEGHVLLQGRYQQLVSTITVDEAYPFARELLGTSLNTIQVSFVVFGVVVNGVSISVLAL